MLENLTAEEKAVCDAVAEKACKYFREPLSEIMKQMTDEVYDTIYDYINYTMEADTTYNFRALVERKVQAIMYGLLNEGAPMIEWQTGQAQEYLARYDFEAFRSQVYAVHRDTIQNQLIDDLTKENVRLRSSLKSYEGRY